MGVGRRAPLSSLFCLVYLLPAVPQRRPGESTIDPQLSSRAGFGGDWLGDRLLIAGVAARRHQPAGRGRDVPGRKVPDDSPALQPGMLWWVHHQRRAQGAALAGKWRCVLRKQPLGSGIADADPHPGRATLYVIWPFLTTMSGMSAAMVAVASSARRRSGFA